MKLLKLTLTLILALALISSVYAYSSDDLQFISPRYVNSLPCREIKFQFQIMNSENIINQYHLSVPKYEKYVDFSENDLVIAPGKSKRVVAYAILPCSLSGEVNLDLYVEIKDREGAIKVPLKIDIKSDYSREVSIAPVTVCKGKFGKGSVHVYNPTATPNLILLSADLPHWIELQGNKVVLPENAQADFNFTVYPDSEVGEYLIGFSIKDFSGTEEIPFTVNIKDCENDFKLLNTKLLVVSGLEEEFYVPFSGLRESMSLALQAPEWITMERNISGNYLTLKVKALDVEAGDYDVIVLAQNGETVTQKLKVSVTQNAVVKFLRSYIYLILILLSAIVLLIYAGSKYNISKYNILNRLKPLFNGLKVKKIKNTGLEKLTEKIQIGAKFPKFNPVISFENFDFANFEFKDKVKILKEFKVDFEPMSKVWLWVLLGFALLSVIVYAIWNYFSQVWSLGLGKINFLILSGQELVNFWIKKSGFLLFVKKWLVYFALQAFAYWQYIFGALIVIVIVIGFDKLKSKGYVKKVYDYFFEEPDSDVEEKVYEIHEKKSSVKKN
ncbi:hypothetical protein J4418_00270 [Candidatus Woesearchaeota archaeon]|nr:hypothetical protein [Candidatus Woesearchaeota archaeon]